MDLLAAIPSVVFGLVGFLVLRAPLQDLFRSIGDACAGIPVLNTDLRRGLGRHQHPDSPASCWRS